MRTLLGHFIVKSGVMLVTDPCYEPGASSAGGFPVPNGQWAAYVDGTAKEPKGILVIEHESFVPGTFSTPETNEVLSANGIGVDSGQFGFFDKAEYDAKRPDEGANYGRICELTLGEVGGGIFDGVGAVSTTAFGDGSYSVYVARDKAGNIIAARLDSIGFEEEEYCDCNECEGRASSSSSCSSSTS